MALKLSSGSDKELLKMEHEVEKHSDPNRLVILYEETKRRLNELTILYEMTRISHSALNFDQMLSEIAKALNGFFNFETLSVLLVDETTGRFTLHPSSIGFSSDEIEALGLKGGKGIPGWVAENGTSLLANDILNKLSYPGEGEEILSEMCVPLLAGGKVIGVIDARSKGKGAFSEEDLRLFEMAGGHLAQIIENVRSEERYRTVVESALDGVLVMGEDYRLTYVNERFSELVGCENEALIGVEFLSFLDERGREILRERSLRYQRGAEVPPRYEVRILRKSGEVRTVEISSTMIRDYHGNSNHIAFLKDITETRKMEEQLLQAEKLRAVGEMARGVAHDFNNALAVILGNAQLLLLDATDKEQVDALKVIEKVAKDSSQTVRRLQEFTKSKVRQDLYKMDINAIVKGAVEIARPKWKSESEGRRGRIEVVTQLEQLPSVAGNVSELREVITNLIFNAVEAMPGGGRIEVRTFRGAGKVCIQISDTGIGMSEEVRKKIFEPFFTTKPFTNTGLGLSMAYGIIKRFGGEIEVESEQGRGTSFTLSLPTGGREEEDHGPEEAINQGREARILLIDDEEHVRNAILNILSQGDHQITATKNGEEGIRLFKEKEFDVVLTDLGMPNMSGWEVCKAIKEMSPNTPVGMITGWEVDVDRDKIKEKGLDFIIPKPFDLKQLLNAVAEIMGSKKKVGPSFKGASNNFKFVTPAKAGAQ